MHHNQEDNLSETVKLACEFIEKPSISPKDCGCQIIIADRLTALGFEAEHMRFEDTDNLWIRKGDASPLFVFAGHTDVVPPGPLAQWNTDPFVPTFSDGYLYGRGAADMKGNLAAAVTAIERFVLKNGDSYKGSIALLITSDEEAAFINGTIKVIEVLEKRSEKIDWCLVGEPTSNKHAGDVIKNGRRGSLHLNIVVKGIQGHVAYANLARNPIHDVGVLVQALTETTWDNGNAFFDPTSFQISNIHGGTGANNVIPSEVALTCNFRFSNEITVAELKNRVASILNTLNITCNASWQVSGLPFITSDGALLDASTMAIKLITGRSAQLSTSGGTSDGRHIAPTGAQVIELGVCNHTIHKVNECVKVTDLDIMSDIYEKILSNLFKC